MAIKIEFDADSHKYFVNGREVPSTTTKLSALGFIDDRWFKEGSAEKGTKVHEYVDLIDYGLSVGIPLTIQPYIDAYIQFREDLPSLVPIHSEISFYDSSTKTCGKVDKVFLDKRDGSYLVVDLKSGVKIKKPHALQLTAYCVGLEKFLKYKNIKCGSLYLKPDGRYKYQDYDRLDSVWKAVSMTYNFREGI